MVNHCVELFLCAAINIGANGKGRENDELSSSTSHYIILPPIPRVSDDHKRIQRLRGVVLSV